MWGLRPYRRVIRLELWIPSMGPTSWSLYKPVIYPIEPVGRTQRRGRGPHQVPMVRTLGPPVACSQDVAWTSRATSLGLHNAFGFRAWAFLAIGLSVYDGGKCQLLHKL